MAMSNADKLFQIRNRMAQMRQQIEAPNPTDQQLKDAMSVLDVLDRRLRWEIGGARMWESLWAELECARLQREAQNRLNGATPAELFDYDLEDATDFAANTDLDLYRTLMEAQVPDDILDITLFRTQQIYRPWILSEGYHDQNRLVNVWPISPADRRIEDDSGDEWFSLCRIPTDPSRPPGTLSLHNENFYCLWFRRIGGGAGGSSSSSSDQHIGVDSDDDIDYSQSIFAVYANVYPSAQLGQRAPAPLDNNHMVQAPVWFTGPRVHLLTLQHYKQLAKSLDNIELFDRELWDTSNSVLAALDLSWRIWRQQLTDPLERQQAEHGYRQTLDTVLQVRDRVRDECQAALAHIRPRLAMFTTPGGGGLILEQ